MRHLSGADLVPSPLMEARGKRKRCNQLGYVNVEFKCMIGGGIQSRIVF